MTAKELAEELMKNPDFEVKFSFFQFYDHTLPSMRVFKNIEVNDIGYMDKVILLGGDEI